MRFIVITVLLIAAFVAVVWEGSHIDSAERSWRRDLHRLAGGGHLAELQRLLETGVDVDVRDSTGVTPLLYASLFGRADEASALIAAGADINSTDPRGWNAAVTAAAGGYDAVLRKLISAGADLNTLTRNGRTALLLAVLNGHQSTVALLLEHGARCDVTDNLGQSVLQIAEAEHAPQHTLNLLTAHMAGAAD